MGRELKRVSLDFKWPLNKTWKGYVNPFSEQKTNCDRCDGSGSSKQAKLLYDRWYGYVPFNPCDRGSIPWSPTDEPVYNFAKRNCLRSPEFYGSSEAAILREASRLCDLFNGQWSHHLNADDVAALVEARRLMDLTHVWDVSKGWVPKDPPHTPTPLEVNTWNISGMGHDSINCWVCVKAECNRLGFPVECEFCKGTGVIWPSAEVEQQYENWKDFEPPAGEGYQLWETVSEGSPVSPVFSTPEGLADWLSSPEYRWGKGTKEQWMEFILGPGWAPSFVIGASSVISNGIPLT